MKTTELLVFELIRALRWKIECRRQHGTDSREYKEAVAFCDWLNEEIEARQAEQQTEVAA